MYAKSVHRGDEYERFNKKLQGTLDEMARHNFRTIKALSAVIAWLVKEWPK